MNTKKVLSIVLAVHLLISVVPLSVNAETYSGTCGAQGDNVTWDIDVNQATLFINGTGDMADYEEPSDAPWCAYENYPGFDFIVFGEGVTSVGDNAFRDISVTKITLSSTVKEFERNSFSYGYDIIIAENNPYIKIDDSCVCYSADGKTLIYAIRGLPTSYTVEDGVEEIAPYAFTSTYSYLNSTFILNLPPSIKNIPTNAFYNTEWEDFKKPRFFVDENNPYYSSDEYGVLFDKNKEVLYMAPSNEDMNESGYNIVNYVIPETVKEIADYAFCGCRPQEVLITENVTKIGSCAFRPFYQGGTYRLYIPNTVTSLADDFMGDFSDLTGFFVYYEGTLSEWNTLYSGTNYFFATNFEHKHNVSVYETCTKRVHKCTVCETSIAVEDISDNHLWVDRIDSAEIYCVGGNITRWCNYCFAEKEEYIEPLGHNYQFVFDNNATCTEDGTKHEYCPRCGSIGETVTVEGSKLGHDNTAPTVLSVQTCSQDGISVQACKRCSEITAITESAYGHYDNDKDGKCDDCTCLLERTEDNAPEEPEEPQESNSILTSIIEFFNKIINIFKNLFKI